MGPFNFNTPSIAACHKILPREAFPLIPLHVAIVIASVAVTRMWADEVNGESILFMVSFGVELGFCFYIWSMYNH